MDDNLNLSSSSKTLQEPITQDEDIPLEKRNNSDTAAENQTPRYVNINCFNPFTPEIPVVILIHYKPQLQFSTCSGSR